MIAYAAPDSLDRVIAQLSNEDALMLKSGLFETIQMPSNAPIAEVAQQVLQKRDRLAATNSTVVRVCHVRISHGEEAHPEWYRGFNPDYTAVLFRTPVGERIAILQFMPVTEIRDQPGYWWNRVYDPRQVFNPQGGANGGQPFSSETNRTPAAAASRPSPWRVGSITFYEKRNHHRSHVSYHCNGRLQQRAVE